MYKVFYNQKPILLTTECNEISDDYPLFFAKYTTVESLLKALKSKRVSGLYFYHPNRDKLEKHFLKFFPKVEAAGGFVAHQDGRFLFIYRNDKWDLPKGKIQKKEVLFEGAQGTFLDIDHGTYPFVTSSTTTAAGACTGLGLAPNRVGEVLGIFKAYCTRVGSGPFPTELNDDTGQYLRDQGHEYGSTTGRPRRCGWVDLPALRYAVEVNGVTQLMMMKADVLSGLKELEVCTSYEYRGETITHLPYALDEELVKPNYQTFSGWDEDLTGMERADQLPQALHDYIKFIEQETGVPVVLVSVGPDRAQTLWRRD